MKHNRTTRLNSHEQEQTRPQAAQAQTTPVTAEFHTTEAMLQHDAAQTPVPPAIARRLRDSIAQENPAPRPWWRRILGG